jgi:hypothetical protein
LMAARFEYTDVNGNVLASLAGGAEVPAEGPALAEMRHSDPTTTISCGGAFMGCNCPTQ